MFAYFIHTSNPIESYITLDEWWLVRSQILHFEKEMKKLLPQFYLVLIIICLFAYSVTVIQYLHHHFCQNAISSTKNEINSDIYDAHLLDGCYHIYLDVGTNIGIQVWFYGPKMHHFMTLVFRYVNYTSLNCIQMLM